MKKFLIFFLLIFGLGFFLTFKTSSGNYLVSYSYCDTPITYRLGTIDPRFKLTEEQVLSYTNEASALWNEAYGKPIFSYAPDGKVTINFSFDQRQALNDQINNLEKKLDEGKESLDPQVASFQARSREFERKLSELNQKISYWNNQGGAPPDVYNELEKERSALQQEADTLNGMASSLNQSTRAYNTQVKELNSTLGQLKKTLAVRPEEGLYDPANNSIVIFFNNTKDELVHTLAHELGHARGIGHIESREAIMYANSSEIVSLSPEDIAALQEVCQQRSYLQFFAERYIELMQNLRMRLTNS